LSLVGGRSLKRALQVKPGVVQGIQVPTSDLAFVGNAGKLGVTGLASGLLLGTLEGIVPGLHTGPALLGTMGGVGCVIALAMCALGWVLASSQQRPKWRNKFVVALAASIGLFIGFHAGVGIYGMR